MTGRIELLEDCGRLVEAAAEKELLMVLYDAPLAPSGTDESTPWSVVSYMWKKVSKTDTNTQNTLFQFVVSATSEFIGVKSSAFSRPKRGVCWPLGLSRCVENANTEYIKM